jgi:predicted nucleic acid-binding protein
LTVYSDSSFITALYTLDAHLPEATRRMGLRPSAWLTQLNRSEVAHAMSQYVFRSKISSLDALKMWKGFQRDCAAGVWISVGLPESIWETSIHIAQQFGPTLGVRTLDSLHVACALELKAERFWTFDQRQEKLAEAVGLDTAA